MLVIVLPTVSPASYPNNQFNNLMEIQQQILALYILSFAISGKAVLKFIPASRIEGFGKDKYKYLYWEFYSKAYWKRWVFSMNQLGQSPMG
jgi:hypothetical protein